MKREQAQKTVEFRLSKSVKGGLYFKETFYYVCSRRGTGGAKVYEKKHAPNKGAVTSDTHGISGEELAPSKIQGDVVSGLSNRAYNLRKL